MPEEEVDYHALKEQRARDREEIHDLKDAFSLNIGNSADKMIAILQGQYKTPSLPGEPERITRHDNAPVMHSPRARFASGGAQTQQQYSPVQYAPQANLSKYADVVDQLERFPFAENEERREKQMAIIAKSVRTALQQLVIQEVANNTKKAMGEYAIDFERKPGGLKAVFNFGDKNISVMATGAFQGDETILVHKVKGRLAGAVVKIREGDDFDDLSSNFYIQVD
jgi:hypothetical protein